MGKPIEFEVTTSGGNWPVSAVSEKKTGRHVAEFCDNGKVRDPKERERAAIYCAHLNEEHKHGRVAQSRCSKGEACDHERVNLPQFLTAIQRDAIVLCSAHAAEVDAARKPRAA